MKYPNESDDIQKRRREDILIHIKLTSILTKRLSLAASLHSDS